MKESSKRRVHHGATKEKNKWIKTSGEQHEVALNGPSITPISKQAFDCRSSNRLTFDKISKGAKSLKGQPVQTSGGNREFNWNKKKTFNDVETYRKETKNMSRSLNG